MQTLELQETKSADFITTELQKFNIADAAIAEWSEKFSSLTINGIEDTPGYFKVREARLFIKGRRVEVEKTSKLLKSDALAFQRAVNDEEKRIIKLLDPIETHLEDEEKSYEAEKQRIKEEKERKEQERINSRIAQLLQNGCSFNGDCYSIDGLPSIFPNELKFTSDVQFENLISSVIEQNEKEIAARLAAKEEAERLQWEENERLQRERAEIEAIRAEQAQQAAEIKAQQEAINTEKEKIENERISRENQIKAENDKKQRAIELERATAEAAKKAKAYLIEKQRIEAERKAESDRKAKLRADRLEALKPVKQKLADFAKSISVIEIPVLNDSEADAILLSAKDLLAKVTNYILEKSETL